MRSGYPSCTVSSKQSSFFFAAYFGVLGALLPYLGPYLRARAIGAVGIGLITAAVSLAKVVYAPLVGAVVDRGRWLPGMLVLHAAVAVASALAVLLVQQPWQLGVAFFLLGLGHATVLPIVEAAILERVPAGGYGALRMWGSIGFIVVAVGAGPLLSAAKVIRFPVLLVVSLALLVVACRPFERSARPHPRVQRGGSLPAEVWWLLGVLALNQVAHGPYYAFFSLHLEDAGWSSTLIGVLWSAGVVAESVAFSFGARLERWRGLRGLLGSALLLAPVRWVLLALPPVLPIVIVAQAMHAVTFAVAHLAGIQLVQHAVPEGMRRRAQALYSGLTFGLGITVGSALAGPLYAAAGGEGAFLAAAGLSVVVFTLWIPLARRLRAGSQPV
jgi:MFS transporter, PPP family, 3-phenylpropionic acid transporter